MVGDDEDKGPQINRPCIKSRVTFNNYSTWKHKLRENCFKRVREDRTRLLWKLRLPQSNDVSTNDEDLVKSTFQDIVSDELKKIKTSLKDTVPSNSVTDADELIWEYDGLHTAYQGDCEEILLEMQRMFYEDLNMEKSRKELQSFASTWEDEEDEYLAREAYELMKLNDEEDNEKMWCPVCKQGELKENEILICCTRCNLKLERGNEVDLEVLKYRLGESHMEHLDKGCRLRPEFCVESKYGLTALYIKCQGCNTFDVVL